MTSDGSFHKTTPAVFESDADPVVASPIDIKNLVEAASLAQGRARLILHPTRGDSLHEMVIALPQEERKSSRELADRDLVGRIIDYQTAHEAAWRRRERRLG
jgi:hypothetical protein